VTPQKNTEICPLFKCNSATLSFYASKDGKISVSFSGWDASKVRYLRLVPIKLVFRGVACERAGNLERE
jgi:hypothetical protein